MYSCKRNQPQLLFHQKEKVYKQISLLNNPNQKNVYRQFKDSIKSFFKLGIENNVIVTPHDCLLFNQQKNKFVTVVYASLYEKTNQSDIYLYLGRKIKGKWYFMHAGVQPITCSKNAKKYSFEELKKRAYELVLGGYIKFNFDTNKWECNSEFFNFHFDFGYKEIRTAPECDIHYNIDIYNPNLTPREIYQKNLYKSKRDRTTYKSLKGSSFTKEQINDEYFIYQVMHNHYTNHSSTNEGIPMHDVFPYKNYKITYEKLNKQLKISVPVKRWNNDYPIGQYYCFDYWVDSVYRCDKKGFKSVNYKYIQYNDKTIDNVIPNVMPNSHVKFRNWINVFGFQDNCFFVIKMKNGIPAYQGIEDPDKIYNDSMYKLYKDKAYIYKHY